MHFGQRRSYSAKRGQAIAGVLIAPVTRDGAVLMPMGTELQGRITEVHRVGLGVMRERARLAFVFDRAVLPTGEALAITSRLHAVVNARESLDRHQRVVGIRATATLGYSASAWIVGAATADPLLMTFAFAGSSLILRFAESEITYPAGTELLVTLAAPLAIPPRPGPREGTPTVEPLTRSAAERDALTAFVAALPFRTATPAGQVSDITNVLLIGDAAAIDRALHAAGWSTTDELNASTAYRTFRSMAENKGYDAAPMSMLRLDGHAPHETWQKGLNTFAKRHHLRLFQRDERWNGASRLAHLVDPGHRHRLLAAVAQLHSSDRHDHRQRAQQGGERPRVHRLRFRGSTTSSSWIRRRSRRDRSAPAIRSSSGWSCGTSAMGRS